MDDLVTWIRRRDSIAHRHAALRAGYTAASLRRSVDDGDVLRIRRQWLAVAGADDELLAAARAGARVACVSVARHRGWWVPDDVDTRLHLRFDPHGRSDAGGQFAGVAHWSMPLAPTDPYVLREPVEDALAHIASCLPRESAIAIWESAVRREKLDIAALRRVQWRHPAARECALEVTGLSDSGLESIFVFRLGPWGLPLFPQAVIAGHRVDLLIGEKLVVQVDGYAYHSGSAERSRDVAHDAELRLRGYTVLRFTYAQIIHDWPAVARAISRAVAAGAHLA
jgi:hypothetical protein